MPSKSKGITKPEKCEYCDGMVEERVARVPFRHRGATIYVDNVPVRVCKKCGETYFRAEVYKRLEKIAEGKRRIHTTISFPLADYRIA